MRREAALALANSGRSQAMPKLKPYEWMLKNVFFLYPSRSDALAGKKFGGTGFFITVPAKRVPGWNHLFGVSNYHVACSQGFSVPRVNRRDGSVEVVDLGPEDWHFLPNGPDLAIALMPSWDRRYYDIEGMSLESVLTREDISRFEINAGDDVFMVGRFIDFDGIGSNVAALRFGHISILEAVVPYATGYKGPSTVIDMHSRTGFSGSPVFVYRTHGSIFAPENSLMSGGHFLKLLGIHWCQFPELLELMETIDKETQPEALIRADKKYVQGMSGMTCVVPGQHLLDLFASPSVKEVLEAADRAAEAIVGG